MLAASHAALYWVTVSMLTGQTDTDGRMSDRYITLSGKRGQSNNLFQASISKNKTCACNLLSANMDGCIYVCMYCIMGK